MKRDTESVSTADRSDPRAGEAPTQKGGGSPDLSNEARNARARHIMEMTAHIFGATQEVRELPDGYSLGYPNDREWAARLHTFSDDARGRLPALNTEVIEPDGDARLRLEIRGPAGTKEYVRAQIAAKPKRRRSARLQKLRWDYRRLTSGVRMMPDFVIIGVARGGTTSLYHYLTQHPSIAPSISKEISFFDLNYSPVLGRYRAYFPTRLAGLNARLFRGRRLITGEASPTYMYFPVAPQRLHATLPHAKLIATLRSPVSRAYSHYNLAVRFGHETASFEDVVERELTGKTTWDFARYLAWGLYADQISRWLALFPPDQLHVVTLEELREDRSGTFRGILDFLGVPPWEPERMEKMHSLPTVSMRASTRERLVEYFRPHNERLYDLLGTDLGWER